jgi:hypothetical protein
MKHIRMLKHAHQLNPGELVGFDDATANALIESGHGEEYTPEAAVKSDKKADVKVEAK